MDETVTGMSKNGPRIVDATAYMGRDAVVQNIPDAMDGTVAKVAGANKIILDTGYLPPNEFVGVHHIDIIWYSSFAGNVSGTKYGLTLQYWCKDTNGNESMSTSVDIDWHDDISDEFGNSGGGGYFDKNKQYRFVIVSHSTLADTEWVGVDFLRIIFEDHWKPSLITVYASPNENPVSLDLDAVQVAVTNNGTAANSYTVEVPMPYDCSYSMIIPGVEASGYIASIPAKSTSTGNGFKITVEHKNPSVTWTGTIVVNVIITQKTYSIMN